LVPEQELRVPRIRSIALVAAVVSMCVVVSRVAQGEDAPGAVYTMSNAASGNQILVFQRSPEGTLTTLGTIDTGGAGTGGGLGNQGGLTLTEDGRWLLAVNAGSNNLTIFAVRAKELEFVDLVSSGGVRPVSVTVHDDLVFVLNAGSDSIAGFQIAPDGQLLPIPGSTRGLSGAGTGPAEIAFSRNGRVLVVTEKNTNLIDTFPVDERGAVGPIRLTPSNGATPFGFAFGKRDQVFVSEAFGGGANASAVSSYELRRDGSLTVLSGSMATNQTAACWVLVTKGERFAYATNTGSGLISGFSIAHDGALTLLTANGGTGDTGTSSSPIDLASSDDGRFLYSLNATTHMIAAFRIEPDGQLTALPFAGGLPVGANGLAAR
jgi:6-phosphogluconolactonase